MVTGHCRLRPLIVYVVVCLTTGCVAAFHLRPIERRRHCLCHQGPSFLWPLPEILLFFALLLLLLLVLRVGPRWFLEIAMVQQVRLFTIAEAAISAASGFVTVFGSVAKNEVGAGQAAQGLVGGVVGTAFGKDAEFWLSSGVVSSLSSPSTLVIHPPFRLQLGTIPGGGPSDDFFRGGPGAEERNALSSNRCLTLTSVRSTRDPPRRAPQEQVRATVP